MTSRSFLKVAFFNSSKSEWLSTQKYDWPHLMKSNDINCCYCLLECWLNTNIAKLQCVVNCILYFACWVGFWKEVARDTEYRPRENFISKMVRFCPTIMSSTLHSIEDCTNYMKNMQPGEVECWHKIFCVICHTLTTVFSKFLKLEGRPK